MNLVRVKVTTVFLVSFTGSLFDAFNRSESEWDQGDVTVQGLTQEDLVQLSDGIVVVGQTVSI